MNFNDSNNKLMILGRAKKVDASSKNQSKFRTEQIVKICRKVRKSLKSIS